jgi:aminoglycoside phosphotransferase (APT) family kinase protein
MCDFIPFVLAGMPAAGRFAGACHSEPVIDEALLRVVSAHAGQPQAFATPPTRMAGGFWAAIYGFELDHPPAGMIGPLVLRVMPNPDGAVGETIVQREVAEQGYPTPRVVLDGFDEGLGGAFMVMERAEGVPLLAGLNVGRLLLRMPTTLRRIAQQLSTATLRLHELDPQRVIDSLEAAGVDVAALGTEARLDEIRHAAAASSAGFGELLGWLESRRPVSTPAVVCHGDIHPFNMLVADDGSFSLLDWTNGNICRREYDVGFTAAFLNCAPLEVPRVATGAFRAITGSVARRFIDSYRAVAPINLDVVEWFETLQYGRCLAAVVTMPTDDPIVGERHPFRLAAPAMVRQLRTITEVTIEIPR